MKKILAMKNFLLVVTLVGVVVSHIFFSSTTEAYKNPNVYEYGAKQGAVLRVWTKNVLVTPVTVRTMVVEQYVVVLL